MMAKSRIKSEEEYNQILGVTQTNNKEEKKTTNDANQYFNELKESQNEVKESNPFDRVISVEQIKENLKHNDNANNVQKIKEQIALAQKEIGGTLSEDEIEDTVVRPAHQSTDNQKEFSFEENARKLYENLRGSNINKQAPKIVEEEPKKASELEVVEPISISKERVSALESPQVEKPIAQQKEEVVIPATSSLEEDLKRVQRELSTDDVLELTADFTMENENFIDAINQRKKSEQPLVQEQQVIQQQPLKNTSTINDDELDINKQLEEQMNMLEDTSSIKMEPKVVEKAKEQPVNERGIADELELIGKPKKEKNELGNTLTLALNQEDSVKFSTKDMKTLKSDDFLDDEKPKGKVGEIIITVALIVMICVVVFLLVKMFI
ncbi:hypothetical protein OKW23_001457 [Bacilli bacterium PM5-9]|nr:hypothetical protein [Bacilli bacterium PM5-9]